MKLSRAYVKRQPHLIWLPVTPAKPPGKKGQATSPQPRLIMPTAGEYRVVEAVVRRHRLPVALRMCGMGPRRAAALCAEFERGVRPRGLALLGWAGGLRDDLAVGDIVIADRALSAGRSDVACLALALAAPGAPRLTRVHRGPVNRVVRPLKHVHRLADT